MLAPMISITLEAPGKNAMGTALMERVRAELRAAGGAPVLLVGAGDAFSAGLDLKEVASLDAPGMARFLALLEELVFDLYTYPGPTAACVNGHAIAGGCVLALTCDVRVMTASPAARIGLSEVALGLAFPPRVLNLARERIPRRYWEEVLLGAGLFEPARAAEIGLVDELASEPLGAASARLGALGKHPSAAYAATKRRLREGVLGPSPSEQARFEAEDLPRWTSAELKEKLRGILRR